MPATEYAAVRALENGVHVLIPEGRTPSIPARDLRDAADSLAQSGIDSIAFASAPTGERPLVQPTQAMLVSAAAYESLSHEVLNDLSGARRFVDPFTAILDIQWRLALAGHPVRVLAGPDADCAPPEDPEARITRIKSILTLINTHLADPARGRYLTALQLALVTAGHAGTDTSALDLQRSPGGDDIGDLEVPTASLIPVSAIDRSLTDLHETKGIRNHLQEHRRVPSGRALRPAFARAVPVLNGLMGVDEAAFARFSKASAFDALLEERLHILIVHPGSADLMARAAGLAETLAVDADVRVYDSAAQDVTESGAVVDGPFETHVPWADIIVLEGATLTDAPGAAFCDLPLVADFSTTDVLGMLMNSPRDSDRSRALPPLLERADLVLAADAVQRDILLGALAGAHRITAQGYDDDPSLLSLVTTDPQGEALLRFCRRPLRAADAVSPPITANPPKPSDLALAVHYLREGGVTNVASKAAGRIRRLMSKGRN